MKITTLELVAIELQNGLCIISQLIHKLDSEYHWVLCLSTFYKTTNPNQILPRWQKRIFFFLGGKKSKVRAFCHSITNTRESACNKQLLSGQKKKDHVHLWWSLVFSYLGILWSPISHCLLHHQALLWSLFVFWLWIHLSNF